MSQCFNRHSKRPCKTKICQLDLSLFGNKDVLGLEISMHDSVRVTIVDSFNDLVDEALNEVWRKLLFDFSKVLLEIILNILENEVK